MKIKYTHSSGIYIIVETTDSGDIPNIDSNNMMVKDGTVVQFESFKNSYIFPTDIAQAKEMYGDLYIDDKIGSVKVNSEKFIREHFTLDMIAMGYVAEEL